MRRPIGSTSYPTALTSSMNVILTGSQLRPSREGTELGLYRKNHPTESIIIMAITLPCFHLPTFFEYVTMR